MLEQFKSYFAPRPAESPDENRLKARLEAGEKMERQGDELLHQAENQPFNPQRTITRESQLLSNQIEILRAQEEGYKRTAGNPSGTRMTLEQMQNPDYVKQLVDTARQNAEGTEEEIMKLLIVQKQLGGSLESHNKKEPTSPEVLQILSSLEEEAAKGLQNSEQSPANVRAEAVARLKGLADLRAFLEKS